MTTINNASSNLASLVVIPPHSGLPAVNKDGTFTPEWVSFFHQSAAPKINQIASNYISTVSTTSQAGISVVKTDQNTTSIELNATLESIGTLVNSQGFLSNNGSGTFSYVPAGSVISVSVANVNGFVGSVATPTSTPVISLSTSVTGILKGSSSAIVNAIPGTDYCAPGGPLGTPSSGSLINLTGTVPTSAQPNITSVGTLTSLAVSGSVSIGNTVSSSVSNSVTNKVAMVIGGVTYYLLASTSGT